MKTMMALVVLAGAVVGSSVAMATQPPLAAKPQSDAEVQRVIDARLHELLVKLNERNRAI